jgi:Tol biopolymer transport system component
VVRRRFLVLALSVCSVAGGLPAGADAAFPGRDGRIAFGSIAEGGPCPTPEDDDRVCPAADLMYRVKPSGRAQRRLTSCPTLAQCSERDPAWSPDGRRLAFARGGEIWVMNADGSGARSLGVGGQEPAWSPDGRKLVFTRRGFDEFGIATVKLDGSSLRLLTTTIRDSSPTWSTRGTIAFAREFDESRDIVTMNSRGDGLRRLIRRCDGCGHPDFSPDGRQIAYSVGLGAHVYVANRDGKRRLRLTGRGGGSEPAWSPSGSSIAFTRESGSGGFSDIFIMRADGMRARRVAYDAKHRVGDDTAGDYGQASWQPLR